MQAAGTGLVRRVVAGAVFIPARGTDGRRLDLGFASADGLRAIHDRKHPGMLVKRHLRRWYSPT